MPSRRALWLLSILFLIVASHALNIQVLKRKPGVSRTVSDVSFLEQGVQLGAKTHAGKPEWATPPIWWKTPPEEINDSLTQAWPRPSPLPSNPITGTPDEQRFATSADPSAPQNIGMPNGGSISPA